MIIAIDFDGTLVEDKFPNIGNFLPNAIPTIERWFTKGHSLILWTSRGTYDGVDYKQEIIKHLYSKDLMYLFDGINVESPKNPFKDSKVFKFSPKIYADIYIDDKGVGFIKDWNWIKEQVEKHPKFNT